LWILLYSSTFAMTSLVHGVASGANVTMNFDDNNSTAWVIVNQFTGDACWTNYSGFLMTWHVNRAWNGYVYFNNDNSDDTGCVAIILSWWDFYMTWVGKTASWTGYKMKFDNIKLNWNSSKKKYYLSGDAVDDALWSVNHWTSVNISGLNLIDWNKTIVDYSSLTGWSDIANWTSGSVDMVLEDVSGNPVQIISTITWTIVSSNMTWYIFLGKNSTISKSFSVNDGVLKIPLYILRAINNGKVSLKFDYSIPDIDGNNSHTLQLENMKIKKPISKISLSIPSVAIVWNNFTGDLNVSYIQTWNINFVSITWSAIASGDYNFDMLSSNDTGFVAKITPKNPNKTKSKIKSQYQTKSYTIWFSNFTGKTVTYTTGINLNMIAYADKRVDYSKSFTWENLNKEFSGWTSIDTLSFNPILRDKNGYRIPDVKFAIKIEDAGIANSYSGWDCNEIDAWYQTSCKALQFVLSGNTYSWAIDSVLWAKFNYKTINSSNYTWIKVISYKPVTGWKLKFEITNLKNTSDSWNFTNSGNYLDLPSYSGFINHIVFKPFVKLRLQGLGDEANYVDINNSIYLKLNNISSNNVSNLSYNLTWEITKPSSGVSFSTGGHLTWNNLSLNSNSWLNLQQTILFSLAYRFNGNIKFNYNHGYYSYSLNNIWNMKLKPWSFYFNLGWTYKVGWVFVNGIVNKTQKYSSSVKNAIWRTHAAVGISFSSVYNKLRRRANQLTQGMTAERDEKIHVWNLDGWVRYYDCGQNGWSVVVDTWTYNGNNTIILKNCKLIIKWNIYKTNNSDNLVFFLFDNGSFNLTTQNYLTRESNIYITENVSDIQAGLFTKWSIFTVKGGNSSNIWENDVDLKNRTTQINNKQLYIFGSLMSQNNIGWSFLVQWENKFTIWWSRKIATTESFWWTGNIWALRNIAQAFDITFWRWFKYSWSNTIDSNWYSLHCNKWLNKEQWCKYPVYIQFDSSIKNNRLFK